MKSSEDPSVEESKNVSDWSTTSTSFSDLFGDLFGEHQQTVITVGIFAAVLIAFLGICLPLFIL